MTDEEEVKYNEVLNEAEYNGEEELPGERITNVIMAVGRFTYFLLEVSSFILAILWLQSHILM